MKGATNAAGTANPFRTFDWALKKRYDFNIPIVNFPFICSNIPAPTYRVEIISLS